MKGMLEKIRSKPDHIKRSLALTLTVFIFTIIMSIWLSSWDARATSEVSKEKTESPLSGLGIVFSGLTDDIKKGYRSAFSADASSSPATTSVPAHNQGASVFDASRMVIIDASLAPAASVGTSTKAH